MVTITMAAFPNMAVAQSNSHHADDTACNRAWMARDWPSTVASCASAADDAQTQHDTLYNEAFNAPPDFPIAQARELLNESLAELVFVGTDRARVAVAYAKLKHLTLAETARQSALTALGTAIRNLDGSTDSSFAPLAKRAAAVRDLLVSPSYVSAAPESDALMAL